MRDGLLYVGRCPRCEHAMQTKITFGVLVRDLQTADGELSWTCDPDEPFRWVRRKLLRRSDLEQDQHTDRLMFICSCGDAHEGRPETAVFAGCGAVWSQSALEGRNDAMKIQLELGTAEDALRVEQTRELSQQPLDRIRAQANQWRTASGSITTVLAAVALIGAPQAGQAPPLGWLLLAGVGFLALLVGTMLSVFAASVLSGYDHRLMAATVLSDYERERGSKAIRRVQWSILTVLLGVCLLVAAAVGVVASPPPT